MKQILMALALTLACGIALGQTTSPSATDPGTPQAQPTAPTQPPQTNQAPVPNPPAGTPVPNAGKQRVAPGSVIPVQLTKTIDAKKAKTGDEVDAKVTVDLKTQGGEVLIPKDTKVVGHVTEAQARNKDQKESELAIAFDKAEMKGGQDMQMPMSIQAVVGQQRNNSDNSGDQSPAETPSHGGGSTPSAGGGARGNMGGSAPPASTPSSEPGSEPGPSQPKNGGLPPINAQTQGVVGISNLTLSQAQNGTQGSLMTSEKNNVKLESGTMLLLKVNQ